MRGSFARVGHGCSTLVRMRGSFARVGHGSNDPYSTCANASYHLQDGGVLLSVGGDVFFDPNQPSRFIVP